MSQLPGIITVRRLLLVKCVAFLLVALSASPFTAPFAAFDAAEIITVTTVHANDAKLKLIDDVVDPVFLETGLLALRSASVVVRAPVIVAEQPASHSPVLRI